MHNPPNLEVINSILSQPHVRGADESLHQVLRLVAGVHVGREVETGLQGVKKIPNYW